MTDPIGVRLDGKIKVQLEKDAKKFGMATSTYANKILTDWTTTHKPMLENDSIIFPIPLLKMFYNFTKESDYEVVANLISEYWHNTMKSMHENPTIDNYIQSLEAWANNTSQRFTIFKNKSIKHVFHHNWGYSYSKITSIMLRKTFESLGYGLEHFEIKEDMFSYHIHKIGNSI